MKLKETEKFYIYSHGKRLRVTAMFANDDDANAYTAKNRDEGVIASFGKPDGGVVFIANLYDNGI